MTYTSPYGNHNSYTYLWDRFAKYDELGYVAGDVATNNSEKLWITVQNDLPEADPVTDRVWIDDVGGNAVVTLLQHAPGGYSPDPTDQEIAEYNAVTKESVPILRVARIFQDPVTMGYKSEDEHSLANNGLPGRGYNNKQIHTFEDAEWSVPPGVFWNPGIGEPGYVGTKPEKWLYYVNGDYWQWIGWRYQRYYDHHLLVHEGSLYVFLYGHVYEAGAANSYHKWFALYRYNGSGTYIVDSWSLVKMWGPINVDDVDTGGTIRLLQLGAVTKGSNTYEAHSPYILVINNYLNSGQGVVSYGGSWENCQTDESGGNIDFSKYRDYSGGEKWSRGGYYMGDDSDDSWWWWFIPASQNHPDNSWVRINALVGFPDKTAGGGLLTSIVSGDYQIEKSQVGKWWDTGAATPVPIHSPNCYGLVPGYTTSGMNIFLRFFEGWNGIWHESTAFPVEGSVNNGPHSSWRLIATELYEEDDEAGSIFTIMQTSVLSEAGIHNDHIYRGKSTFLAWGPSHPNTKGIYTGTFDPEVVNLTLKQALEFKRNDFWDGQDFAQRSFRISRVDERLYLARPYYVPGDPPMVARYMTPFESVVYSLGAGGTLSEDEDITDNVTNTQGVLGLDLTDGV